MTLFVARHAHAGKRSEWTGDDRRRPLSDRGRAQAEGIADSIGPSRPERLLSSPAVRCVQTLEPLADRLGLDVVVDDRLFEGNGRDALVGLLAEVADGTTTVVSSHGDVIPLLLQLLVADGMAPERNLVWQKASVWVVERDGDGWGAGRYLPPPDQR